MDFTRVVLFLSLLLNISMALQYCCSPDIRNELHFFKCLNLAHAFVCDRERERKRGRGERAAVFLVFLEYFGIIVALKSFAYVVTS